jgi:FMN reductase
MTPPSIVGFSGNIVRPSKTRAFVDLAVSKIAQRHGLAAASFDISDVGASLGNARRAQELDLQGQHVLRRLIAADLLVVGSPTYKGSYTGLFKHFFDLIDPAALRGKPVLLLATGGGERHALTLEHQLRPLFGFFEALTLPTAVYASDKDFIEGVLVSDAIKSRLEIALGEADAILAARVRSGNPEIHRVSREAAI